MARYSGQPLSAKLGLTAGAAVIAFGAPRTVIATVRDEDPEVDIAAKPLAGLYQARPSSFLWVFCETGDELRRALPAARRLMKEGGALWVSWPRRDSWKTLGLDPEKVVTEDSVRASALPLGLVDVKACALDEGWSGLKLMARREDRGG